MLVESLDYNLLFRWLVEFYLEGDILFPFFPGQRIIFLLGWFFEPGHFGCGFWLDGTPECLLLPTRQES